MRGTIVLTAGLAAVSVLVGLAAPSPSRQLAPARAAPAGPAAGGLVVLEVFGSASCPACRAAYRAAADLEADRAGRVLSLTYEADAAPGARIGRWWAAAGSAGARWLPLVMTDGGFRTWSPPTQRAPVWRELLESLVGETASRAAGVSLSAHWTLTQSRQALATIQVTNLRDTPLPADRDLTLHALVVEARSPADGGRFVHSDVPRVFDADLAAGASREFALAVDLPAGAAVTAVDIVVLVDYRPEASSRRYELLGAAIATTDRPTATATATPTATARPSPTATWDPAGPTPRVGTAGHPWPAIQAVARTGNPFLTTTRFVRPPSGSAGHDRPSIVAFRDTDQIAAGRWPYEEDTLTLATNEQTGTVFGLAYDGARGLLYAGAFHDPDGWFPGGQAGTIYRIDLAKDVVTPLARLDAGADPHAAARAPDDRARAAVGRYGLGDLELDDEGATVFAVNLHDRRIYRLAAGDGRVLGSFGHGAAGTVWAANARPFGLGWRGGWLYHGVVDSRESPDLPGSLSAHVFRSRPDGSAMSEVAVTALDYPRQPRWTAWSDAVTARQWYDEAIAQPWLTDLEFRSNGDLIVGLRDRLADVFGPFSRVSHNGDLLPTLPLGPNSWRVLTQPEHYDDSFTYPLADWQDGRYHCTECSTGTLASTDTDGVVASMRVSAGGLGGALWFDNGSGHRYGPAGGWEMIYSENTHGGDLEALWRPGDTLYFPMVQKDLCDARPRPPADITLVVDASTTMLQPTEGGERRLDVAADGARQLIAALAMSDEPAADGPRLLSHDQVAVVGFNRGAWAASELTTHRATARAAVDGLPDRVADGTRLDLALLAARAAATGPWSRQLARRMVVLVTDGWPNGVPPAEDGRVETTVLRAGQALRAGGLELVVLGAGQPDAVNRPLLVALAGDESHYYAATDATSLRRAFADLARRFQCRPAP